MAPNFLDAQVFLCEDGMSETNGAVRDMLCGIGGWMCNRSMCHANATACCPQAGDTQGTHGP